jgi:outer membrane protein
MKKFNILVTLMSAFFASQSFAIDLIGVYQEALHNDPTFQIARAQWLSDRQNVPIARSQLLPQFDIAGLYNRQDYSASGSKDPTLNGSEYTTNSGYTLALTQTLFNYAFWSQLQSAKASVKASTATFAAAYQDLIFRTTSAYFAVLQAIDILNFSHADKISYASQLDQTRERFKVGLATITDLEQAQAAYDTSVATEIKASDDLTVAIAKLAQITGRQYSSFAQLSQQMPLICPTPYSIDRWIDVGLHQNFNVKAEQYQVEASLQDIKTARSGNFPVINAAGSYTEAKISHASGVLVDPSQLTPLATTATAGLTLNFPVLQGGGVIAKTIQAEHNYEKAAATLEQTRRSTTSNIRQAFAGVVDGISTVKANKQSVISHQSSYKSTLAAYHVGTNTMVDVLQQQSQLYQAQKDYAVSQYNYIIQTLSLKNASGILNTADVRVINSWLKKESLPLRILPKPKTACPAKPVALKNIATAHPVPKVDSTVIPTETSIVTTSVEKPKTVVESKPADAYAAKPAPQAQSTTLELSSKKPNPIQSQPVNSNTTSPGAIKPSSLNDYTVQIMVAKDRAILLNTAQKYNLSGYFITPIIHNNQKLNALIFGNYPTKQDAEKALGTLPRNLTSAYHPYVRQFSDLQKEL